MPKAYGSDVEIQTVLSTIHITNALDRPERGFMIGKHGMYNFYQSQLRYELTKDVYKKPTFEIELLGKKHFGVIRDKKLGPRSFRRYQVLGVEMQDKHAQLKKDIENIKNTFLNDKHALFFQLGIIDPFDGFPCKINKNETVLKAIRLKRDVTQQEMKELFDLEVGFKENLPNSTIMIDLGKKEDELRADVTSNCKQAIKKAQRHHLEFVEATPEDRDKFYHIRKGTASKKAFFILTKSMFVSLKEYIIANKAGALMLVKAPNGDIVSGSIYLFDKAAKAIIYLYGATDRKAGNIGANNFLKREVMRRGKKEGYQIFDLLGGAPTGYPKHELVTVSHFKESMGGVKYELTGSYDIVGNKILYKIYKMKEDKKQWKI